MENELDLTKILKVGDKVYSTIGGDGVVLRLGHLIIVKDINGGMIEYTPTGKLFNDIGECILFPSKDQRDWSKFKRPVEFKPGQLVLVWDNKETDGYFDSQNAQIGIYKRLNEETGRYVASLHIHDGPAGGVKWDNCEPFDIEEYLKQQSEQ